MSADVRRFGDFELDSSASELRRNGQIVHLEHIPLELLNLLTERSGQLVTREEIVEHVWGKGVFVETESSINTAVRKIRRALDDDADAPQFVVTIPAKGYRFVAPVVISNGELIARDASVQARPAPGELRGTNPRGIHKYWRVGAKYCRGGLLSLAGLAFVVGIIVFVQHLSLRPLRTRASIHPNEEPALPLPNIPSVAVLPFTNLTGDPHQDYFSDGITDDLITDLSRLQHLFVIARTSTFAYKSKAVNVQQVSRELGVRFVLEGSVRKEANRVRINAQLVDAATGAELWAQRYERPMTDVFTLQDDIVRRIVTTLNLQLTMLEQGTLVRRNTDNLEAYDDVLRAAALSWTMTKAGNAKARLMFERALELDPGYADAYEGLGETYWLDWFYGYSEDTDAPRRSAELAQRTIALDDSNSAAYALLGQVDLVYWHYDQAIADGERSIALEPNSAHRYWYLANTLIFSGKPAEAIDLAKKAMRLDPRHGDMYLVEFGFAYSVMGRYREAISVLQQSLAAYPNNIGGRLILVFAYTEVGRNADARAEAAEVLRLSPHFSSTQRGGPRIKDKALRDRYIAAWNKAGL